MNKHVHHMARDPDTEIADKIHSGNATPLLL